MMKKEISRLFFLNLLSIMAVGLMISTGCYKLSNDEVMIDKPQVLDPYAVVVNETLNLWDILYGSESTKSSRRIRPKVSSVDCCRHLSTRGEDGSVDLDTLVYIVNLKMMRAFPW